MSRAGTSRPTPRALLTGLAVAVALVAAPAAQGAGSPAATRAAPATSGPALTVPAADLASSLNCRGDLAAATRPPVLLAPDYATSEQSYGWNLARQLPAVGVPVCTLDLEHPGTEDIQEEAEHVVHAVREMRARSGRQVVLVGHAFVALAERWALTFWPDVAASVSDLIAIAAPDQGTDLTSGFCAPGRSCPPSAWQARTGSRLLARLNRDPLPIGAGDLAFTTISSSFDELIYPQPRASTLPGARNIALQDVCPGRVSDHFVILGDAVAYRLILDAIDHPGPADPARLPAGSCAEQFLPGLTEDVLNLKVPIAAAGVLTSFPVLVATRGVAAEPALRPYATTADVNGAGASAPAPPTTKKPGPAVRILTKSARLSRTGEFVVRITCTSAGASACTTRATSKVPARVRLPGGRRVRITAPRAVLGTLRANRPTFFRVKAPAALRSAVRAGGRVSLRLTLRGRTPGEPGTADTTVKGVVRLRR